MWNSIPSISVQTNLDFIAISKLYAQLYLYIQYFWGTINIYHIETIYHIFTGLLSNLALLLSVIFLKAQAAHMKMSWEDVLEFIIAILAMLVSIFKYAFSNPSSFFLLPMKHLFSFMFILVCAISQIWSMHCWHSLWTKAEVFLYYYRGLVIHYIAL